MGRMKRGPEGASLTPVAAGCSSSSCRFCCAHHSAMGSARAVASTSAASFSGVCSSRSCSIHGTALPPPPGGRRRASGPRAAAAQAGGGPSAYRGKDGTKTGAGGSGPPPGLPTSTAAPASHCLTRDKRSDGGSVAAAAASGAGAQGPAVSASRHRPRPASEMRPGSLVAGAEAPAASPPPSSSPPSDQSSLARRRPPGSCQCASPTAAARDVLLPWGGVSLSAPEGGAGEGQPEGGGEEACSHPGGRDERGPPLGGGAAGGAAQATTRVVGDGEAAAAAESRSLEDGGGSESRGAASLEGGGASEAAGAQRSRDNASSFRKPAGDERPLRSVAGGKIVTALSTLRGESSRSCSSSPSSKALRGLAGTEEAASTERRATPASARRESTGRGRGGPPRGGHNRRDVSLPPRLLRLPLGRRPDAAVPASPPIVRSGPNGSGNTCVRRGCNTTRKLTRPVPKCSAALRVEEGGEAARWTCAAAPLTDWAAPAAAATATHATAATVTPFSVAAAAAAEDARMGSEELASVAPASSLPLSSRKKLSKAAKRASPPAPTDAGGREEIRVVRGAESLHPPPAASSAANASSSELADAEASQSPSASSSSADAWMSSATAPSLSACA